MTDGATNGLRILMELSFNQFLEPNLWMKAMTDMVAMTSLGRGGFILAGSYLSASSSSGLITVMADIIFVIFVSVFTIMFHINFAILSTAAKLHKANMSQAVGNPNEPVELTIIPNGLGYTSTYNRLYYDIRADLAPTINVPQLWNVLYFLASIIFCYSFIIINVRIVEITIEDSHMNFRRYRKYILFAFLSVTLIGSVIFVSNGLYMYTVVKYKQSLDYFEVFITFTFTMLVSWIYGVQKLCDDIHFIIGVQPARYWKICWYFAPLVLGIVCLLQIKEMSDEMNIYTMIAVALLGCPLTVMSIIETFRYIKRRNLLGLFQPEEHWGPPEQSIRHLRLIFNPRKEVRSRRRNETCQHKCLLGSKALKRVIYEEEKFQTTFEDAQQQKQNQTVEENQQNALKDNP
ncbi:PREDICTED: sodium-dependent nutrient amino acid transporter 1-like [Nicrophorus vespilloides]|uniref:Sodium-dependent nutrient amino acid transporter 1-like n=1 Tax=Nicrophorus vespilloides TaxID=110193 RepID=A0ABM1N753_NICVS|nr:PREDICTED: sodium-dependent nutrient amino acid transporter 1-like [Nicrophorus vespilloides]